MIKQQQYKQHIILLTLPSIIPVNDRFTGQQIKWKHMNIFKYLNKL